MIYGGELMEKEVHIYQLKENKSQFLKRPHSLMI